MALQLISTAHYVRSWLTGHADVVEEETTLDRNGSRIPATIVKPAGMNSPLPGWVILHGITRTGRAHPQLVRFTRTVAATGMVVIIPEVPEWRAKPETSVGFTNSSVFNQSTARESNGTE